jgi:phosphoserine phosphatase
MIATKTLFILDLDHTLIYGSFAEKESADLMFRYHKYLTVYERPLARELIKICNINYKDVFLNKYIFKLLNKTKNHNDDIFENILVKQALNYIYIKTNYIFIDIY